MNFNEQGSRVMDLSPSGAHGRLIGFGSPAKRHIQGLDFDSTIPSYGEIPAVFTQLDFTSEDFSVIARVRVDDLTATRQIVSRGASNVDGYHCYIAANGSFNINTSQGAAFQETRSSLGAIATAAWYTVGFSRSGASIIACINGVADTAIAGIHINPLTSPKAFRIAIYSDAASNPFDGKMEFLRVFRGIALTEAQHKAIHEQPNAPYGYPLFI